MNVSARLIIAAVLAQSLALPAAATTVGRMSLSAQRAPQRAQLGARALGAREVFAKFHAHHRPQVAHFAFPFGLATDKFGDLFVTNFDANNIVEVTPALRVLPRKISQQVVAPLSVAVDGSGDVYVGNGSGNITQYSSKGVLLQTIAANTAYPFGIAVDQFQDVFILTPSGIAIDDASGAQIFGNISSGAFDSISIGGPTVYAFFPNTIYAGNGSVALRAGSLQFGLTPSGSAVPIGSACSSDRCWYTDNENHLLNFETGNTVTETALPYAPAGAAYDPIHNRLFIADSADNKIQVYNAKTLVFEQTLT